MERFPEIIGEGVNRLPPQIHDPHPEIPWRVITDWETNSSTATVLSMTKHFGTRQHKKFLT